MALLVFYLVLALSISFLCSVLEAVLLSVTPSFTVLAERDGKPFAKRLAAMKADIDRPLAAILSLNTVAHTVGAAGVGAQAAIVFKNVPLGVISGVLTLAILIISEIIPKTLGAVYWRSLAPAVVRILRPVMVSMWPLVKLSQGIGWLIAPKHKQASVSREELAALAQLGTREGVFDEGESRILENLFKLGSLDAQSVMTPRIVMFALPSDSTVDAVVGEHQQLRFSRIPIHRNNRDQITGYVLKTDILLHAARGQGSTPLSDLQREMAVVPATLSLPKLLERLLDQREHIALVVDEFGGTAGVVTMEDVVETLLGLEIVDEADHVEDMQALARARWLERARRLGVIREDDLDEEATRVLAQMSLDSHGPAVGCPPVPPDTGGTAGDAG